MTEREEGDGQMSRIIEIVLLVLVSVSNTLAVVDCIHPGVTSAGTEGLVTVPCSEESFGATTSGVPSPAVTYAELQATYDLDVILIERTPRYPSYCIDWQGCPGQAWCQDGIGALPVGPSCDPMIPIGACEPLIDGKRWPTANVEDVTYVGHIKNHGGIPSSSFEYTWLEDGQVVLGPVTVPNGVAPGAILVLPDFVRTFPAAPKDITLKVTFTTGAPDLFNGPSGNNELSINTHALAFKYFVHQSIYDDFNQRQAAYTNTFGFEHWAQKHVEKMNQMIAASIFPINSSSPDDSSIPLTGVQTRLRIDVFEVYTGPASSVRGRVNDEHFYCTDGAWNTVAHPTWVDNVINETPHWPLIHELGHFGGVRLTDLYEQNMANISPNNGLEVTRADNPLVVLQTDSSAQCPQPLPRSREPLCPIVWDWFHTDQGDVHGGGYTYPGLRQDRYSMHAAAALARRSGKRGGHFGTNYYGAQHWDTPSENYLRVLDDDGNPVAGAQVKLFQKRGPVSSPLGPGSFIDNIAEISGTTNVFGVMELPKTAMSALASLLPPKSATR